MFFPFFSYSSILYGIALSINTCLCIYCLLFSSFFDGASTIMAEWYERMDKLGGLMSEMRLYFHFFFLSHERQ
jgi:hypothetical protein